eukprot:11059622-Alexandrium_andersonii.AAC.1
MGTAGTLRGPSIQAWAEAARKSFRSFRSWSCTASRRFRGHTGRTRAQAMGEQKPSPASLGDMLDALKLSIWEG